MKKSKKSKAGAKPKSAAKTKIRAKSKSKANKTTPKKGVSLEALVAEVERISSRLDSLEKEIRDLKGIAYPIGA
jgi:hypothetical protein